MLETEDAVELATDGPLTALFTRALSRLGPVLCFLVVVAVVGVGRGVTWMDPPPSDSHVYAYVGRAWLNGNLPYARVWEMKPPGIFAIDAAVFALFPDSFHALAVVEGLCMLGCAITVFLILRQGKVDRVACYLGVFVFAIVANSEWTSSNLTELYLLWPVALSML